MQNWFETEFAPGLETRFGTERKTQGQTLIYSMQLSNIL